jgi:HSP20 family protein
MANITRKGERRNEPSARLWDPFRILMSDVFGPEMLGGGMTSERSFAPDIEVKETKQEFAFCADLPGVREDDVDIRVDGNRLTISGKREEEKRDEEDRYYAYERSFGSFSRSFVMPDSADMDKIQADLKDGVLRVEVPKKAETQPKRVALGGRKETLTAGEPEKATKPGEKPKAA